ncbi:anthranilate phosphoribosyltransferase [Synechococcus sp. PCC 7502]|uniref:anthranilate phosphoribosyltransferase n=1 Tax=Synechococcus sp. PCC 7502 TaxID=1173263 RepID=UPI00029F9123|nr:anthranilate phosphoribosyltransferase [Synechococcus sp. PCC 7502]AFY74599.1 anthranilate phosphoribosyltransferase [Synechococcus sp. PCC 7502]
MTTYTWSALLQQLINGRSLTAEQAQSLMSGWLAEAISPELSGAILAAWQCKGVDAIELAAIAGVLQDSSLGQNFPIDSSGAIPLLDTCGTGGDGANTFNISTGVAFVAASAGVKVAKHGNRAVSSRSGSADVLEALGINLSAPTAKIHEAIAAVGITFLFAPHWHPAMKAVAPIRKSLGIRTIFNLIGPLVNPLLPTTQILGVYDRSLIKTVAEALKILGRSTAVVLHSREGMDEAGLADITDIAFLRNDGTVTIETINPHELGLAYATLDDLKGGTVGENTEILKKLLQGQGTIAQRDCLALNAGIALHVAGICDRWEDGINIARSIIDSGEAWQKLESLASFLK